MFLGLTGRAVYLVSSWYSSVTVLLLIRGRVHVSVHSIMNVGWHRLAPVDLVACFICYGRPLVGKLNCRHVSGLVQGGI